MQRVITNATLPVLTMTLVISILPPRVAQGFDERLGRAQMLDHVQQQHVVERSRIHGNLAAVQIRLDEIRDVRVRGRAILIDARNVASLLEQSASDVAGRAPQIRDLRPGRHPLHRQLMRTFKSPLGQILLAGRRQVELALIQDAEILRPGKQGDSHHVQRVFQAVHAADLVAVVGGNRELLDAKTGAHELNNDFGIEVKIVGILVEGNACQRFTE